VLSVSEPAEPRNIIWTELNSSLLVRSLWLGAGLVACILYFLMSWAIVLMLYKSPWCVALALGGLNIGVAPVMIFMTKQEIHLTRESESVWLLGKLVAVRWSISVLLLRLVTPFESTISDHTIYIIRDTIIVDALMKPVFQALDLSGLFDRHVLAPFADTQEKMNRFFLGSPWNLAERYSDMSKSIFLALSFATIYPYGYFVGAFANLLAYLSDKYCLFRVWKHAEPQSATLTSYHRATLAVAFLFHCFFTMW
jgi:uncharacterized membrane protein